MALIEKYLHIFHFYLVYKINRFIFVLNFNNEPNKQNFK